MSRSRASFAAMRIALLALGLAACGEIRESSPRELCLLPSGTEILPDMSKTFELEPGEPLELVAVYRCIDEPLESECEVVLEGNAVIIHTSLQHRVRERIGEDDGCGIHVVRCAAPQLSAGMYQLRFGPRTIPFVLPSTAPAPCLFNLP